MSQSKSQKNKHKKDQSNFIEIEIYIDHETGDLLLPRDHELMVKLAEYLESEDSDSFKKFFDSKPENLDGDKNYTLFCG